MRPSDSAWRELVDRLLDAADEKPGGYKKMYFMEKLGFQDHTVYSYLQSNIIIYNIICRLMNSQIKDTSGGGSLVPISTSPLMESLTPAPYILCKSHHHYEYLYMYSCLGFQLCPPSCWHLRIGSFSHSSSTRGMT